MPPAPLDATAPDSTVAGLVDPVALANGLRPVLLHLQRHLRRELHSVGVSGSQVSLLAAIAKAPGIGVAELAEREGTSRPSICSHIDRLEAGALVVRTRTDGGDRRRVGITCTADGLRVLRTVRSRRTAWLAARLRELPPGELAAIEGALPALHSLAERR